MKYKILDDVENVIRNFDKPITRIGNLKFSQKNKVKTIEYYTDSAYLNGQLDELGREKPFMQITNAVCDVENSAKDIDTKDITITSDNSNNYLKSFLLNKDIYEWMKDVNFAKTLNDMRDTHTRYGSLLVKKCIKKDKDGKEIYVELPEWKNVINDQVSILNGAIIEVHYKTRTQIRKMESWDSKNIDALFKLNPDTSKRIPIYEVRGEFAVSDYKQVDGKKPTKKDDNEFSYQLYYLGGFNGDMNQNNLSKIDVSSLIPLYWENDTEKVYKYLARKPRSGRSFGVGVIEEGEQAQIGTNDALLKQSRAMEYTSKVIAQSASKKLKGRNILTEVTDGTILEHDDNRPITSVNLLPSGGLTQYQNLMTQWYTQFERTTSAYNAQRGEDSPSGTPFRLQAQNLAQSASVFKDLQEEIGIFITEIFNEWIIPFKLQQLTKDHILAHEFSPDELAEIDKNFATHQANKEAFETIVTKGIITQAEYDAMFQKNNDAVKQTKSSRFINIPKGYFTDMKPKVTVNVTGEQYNKAAILESLMTIMQTYAANPSLTSDPVLTKIFMTMVEVSGANISPVTLMGLISQKEKSQQAQQQSQPQQPEQTQGQPVPSKMSLSANPTVPTQ